MGRLRRPAAGRQPVVAAVAALVVVSSLGLWLGRLGGVSRGALVAGLIVPAAVMSGYWVWIRHRLDPVGEGPELVLERVRSRTLAETLAAAGHLFPVHPEPCNLRAEALAVAVEYRQLRPDLKVVVPSHLVAVTDPYLLRLALHLLLDNAVRHGGVRVAVWADQEDGRVSLTVSDDGPGLGRDLEAVVHHHLLDLGEGHPRSGGGGTGLALARLTARLLEGEMVYRRDGAWTHFGIRIPDRARGGPEPAADTAGAGAMRG